MELQYYGGNCVRITTKKAAVTIDDNLADIGAKSISKAGDVNLFTGPHGAVAAESKIVIDTPGEYEVSDISIQGIAARAHIDEESKRNATMFRIIIDDIRIAVVGHVYPSLSSSQLEALNTIDVLIIPVGGNGYTLDPIGAMKLIKDIDPKIIVPTHYDESGLNFPVPQQSLADAIKGLSMEAPESIPKLKIKSGELGEAMHLVVLDRQ